MFSVYLGLHYLYYPSYVNPLWLKIVATMIQDIFRGKVVEFLKFLDNHLRNRVSPSDLIISNPD